MEGYWESRKDLSYYRVAIEYAKILSPQAASVLDVGGGIQWGCRYLEWLPGLDRTSVELPSDRSDELPGVRLIKADFLEWSPPRTYDVVICLQCIEHVKNADAFAEKLLSVAKYLVVSVPFRWRRNAVEGHVHDPIDDEKMRQWFKRKPVLRSVVDQRLILGYGDRPLKVKTVHQDASPQLLESLAIGGCSNQE